MTEPVNTILGTMKGDKITACSCCGGPVSFVTNDVVYGTTSGLWPYIYLCDDVACAAYVGCHQNTDNPLGTMANTETRRARQKAHAAFDPIWKTRKMKRRDAYQWLSKELGISYNECHIGMFDVEQCEKVVNAVMQSGIMK